MRPLLDYKALFRDYASYHTHPKNRLLHCFGIPLIVFCVVRWSQFGPCRFPWAALFLLVYAAWDFKLGAAMTAVVAVMAAIGPLVGLWTVAALFVFGWLLQFLGHWVFEGKSPAFARNLVHLLVGPAFILHEITGLGRPR
jgi:uncharacterized membrane protein YGL010W